MDIEALLSRKGNFDSRPVGTPEAERLEHSPKRCGNEPAGWGR
jgi:hypothetical protein